MIFLHSFSHRAFQEMFSSSVLYPSNYHLRPIEAKESIRESIGTNVDLFTAQKVTSLFHIVGKPLRVVARAVTIVAIGVLVAPAGALYHGSYAAFFAIQYLPSQSPHHTSQQWAKVQKYATPFFE